MKKYISKMIIGVMALSMLAGCSGPAAGGQSGAASKAAAASTEGVYMFGILSYLNMTEDDMALIMDGRKPAIKYLSKQGVAKYNMTDQGTIKVKFYDTLESIIMGLESGDIKATELPKCTADYLVAHNDKLEVKLSYNMDKADDFAKSVINHLGVGFSFLVKEDNKALCEELDKAISEMKKDGTLNKLVKDHINEGVFTEPKPIVYTKAGGDTLKIAVTGSLPPMDYVAPDGSFAGFNTALCAELGRKLNKNIELIQVDSMGRAAALASGKVDAVFWTAGVNGNISAEEDEKFEKSGTEEQKKIIESLKSTGDRQKKESKDRPAGTIATQAYYSDQFNIVGKRSI